MWQSRESNNTCKGEVTELGGKLCDLLGLWSMAASAVRRTSGECANGRVGRVERVTGIEPATFCMASRRSSQLSYTRANRKHELKGPGLQVRLPRRRSNGRFRKVSLKALLRPPEREE